MTTTTTAFERGVPLATANASGSATAPRDPPRLVASLSLALLTSVSAASMGRLFSDASPVRPIVAAVLLAHTVALLTRLVRAPWLLGLVASAGGLVVLGPFLTVRPTTRFGMPTTESRDVIVEALRAAWQSFSTVKAPVEPSVGFTVAAMAGAWLAAVMADGLAMRLGLAAEALVGPATLVVFTGALAPPTHRVLSVGAFAAAAALFGVAWRQTGHGTTPWMGGRRAPWPSVTAAMATVALAAAVGAAAIAPQLPRVGADGLVDWKRGGRSSKAPRTAISPLVSVRARLVNQSDSEMFSVAASSPSYWRLTSLERFDGTVWSSSGSYRRAGTTLKRAGRSAARISPLAQDIRIEGLSSIWLPAAYRPIAYDSDESARYDPESGSLITTGASVRGARYQVRSELPVLSADELSAAGDDDAPGDLGRSGAYRALPASFPTEIRTLARRVSLNAPSPYAKALALQQFFRANFTYDLTVDSPSGAGAMREFLFETRRGYCEQFAGSFAAMARSLGLEARVAVGFTAGELGADGRFHVSGRNAHAWPEVHLGSFGWVAFEPTPGRSIPGADGYTPTGSPLTPPVETTLPAVSVPTTVPAVNGSAPSTPPTSIAENAAATNVPPERAGRSRRWWIFVAALGCLVAALVGPSARAVRARRRAAAVRDAHDALDAPDVLATIELAWQRVRDAASWAGIRHRPGETSRAYAERVGSVLDDRIAMRVRRLAALVDRVRFAGPTNPPHPELVPARSPLPSPVGAGSGIGVERRRVDGTTAAANRSTGQARGDATGHHETVPATEATMARTVADATSTADAVERYLWDRLRRHQRVARFFDPRAAR